MLKRKFDPMQPHRVVLYLRYSSGRQRPTSLDQQRDTIRKAIARLKYPWVIVDEFSDAKTSGKYVNKRPGFKAMREAIYSGALVVDAIVVDTYERFGRADELAGVRDDLYRRHGVLVLTEDSDFADPTSVSGKTHAVNENLRATENNRVRTHDIMRGKRAAVLRGHWPGGLPQFGFKLERRVGDPAKGEPRDYTVLVPDAVPAGIMHRIFTTAAEDAVGSTTIVQRLNADPTVPDEFKPFLEQTVNKWLNDPIYMGTFRWEVHATDIQNDRKVKEKNAPEDVLIVPNFCPPVVDEGLWKRAQEGRRIRKERARLARQAARTAPVKYVAPLVPGLALKYPLSGLIRCAACGRAMVCNSSAPYETAAGEVKRYAYYQCPAHPSRVCPNARRVPEGWLRATVLDLVCRRLFPVPGAVPGRPLTVADLRATDWFPELMGLVGAEIARRAAGRPDPRVILAAELDELDEVKRGWLQSLGKPRLAESVRDLVESNLARAEARRGEIERLIAGRAAEESLTAQAVDPEQVADRLNRLAEVLGRHNPTRCNIELAGHIEGVHCHPDGSVVVRTCKLGSLSGAVELLAAPRPAAASPRATGGPRAARSRRLALRRLTGPDADSPALADLAELTTDVRRFAGLGPEWFWDDEFQVPGPMSWARANAPAVAAMRKEKGLTEADLAKAFKKSIPTIRAALDIARESDPALAALPRKMGRDKWEALHQEEVQAMQAAGKTIRQMAQYFDVSPTTVMKAVKRAKDKATGTGEGGAAG